jgi:hypothetical protein
MFCAGNSRKEMRAVHFAGSRVCARAHESGAPNLYLGHILWAANSRLRLEASRP